MKCKLVYTFLRIQRNENIFVKKSARSRQFSCSRLFVALTRSREKIEKSSSNNHEVKRSHSYIVALGRKKMLLTENNFFFLVLFFSRD